MKLEVTLSLCAMHASEMGWPQPRLGFAKGECFACGKVSILHVVGKESPDDSNQSGRLEADSAGKMWFIPLRSEI